MATPALVAAHDDERAVLVHGDVHRWNALRAGDGFTLVDPDGLRAEPGHDLGVVLREDPDTPAAGRDRRAGLAARMGRQPVGRDLLAAADAVAAVRAR